jgi:hypothetical protein
MREILMNSFIKVTKAIVKLQGMQSGQTPKPILLPRNNQGDFNYNFAAITNSSVEQEFSIKRFGPLFKYFPGLYHVLQMMD